MNKPRTIEVSVELLSEIYRTLTDAYLALNGSTAADDALARINHAQESLRRLVTSVPLPR